MFLLVTNNEALLKNIEAESFFVNGSALDVLIEVRSKVHLGSLLLTHPLCGNLRPSHQPFRSVLIDERKGLVDLESLSIIEEAVNVYKSSKIVLPVELNENARIDYSFIDFELMRESLEQYGFIKNKNSINAAPLLLKN